MKRGAASATSAGSMQAAPSLIARAPASLRCRHAGQRGAGLVGVDDPRDQILRVVGIQPPALGHRLQPSIEIRLMHLEQRYLDELRCLLAGKDLLGDPEGHLRHAGRGAKRESLVAGRRVLVLPGLQLVLSVAHDDDRRGPTRRPSVGWPVGVPGGAPPPLWRAGRAPHPPPPGATPPPPWGGGGRTPATSFCATVAVHWP